MAQKLYWACVEGDLLGKEMILGIHFSTKLKDDESEKRIEKDAVKTEKYSSAKKSQCSVCVVQKLY